MLGWQTGPNACVAAAPGLLKVTGSTSSAAADAADASSHFAAAEQQSGQSLLVPRRLRLGQRLGTQCRLAGEFPAAMAGELRSAAIQRQAPGPISSTTSVDFTPALSTIDCTTSGFFRMCWPLDLWNSMPACHACNAGSGCAGPAGVKARAGLGSEAELLPPTAAALLAAAHGGRPASQIDLQLVYSPLKPPAAFLPAFFATPPAARRPDMVAYGSAFYII